MRGSLQLLIGLLGMAGTFRPYQLETNGPGPVLEAMVIKHYYCLGQPGGDGVFEQQPSDAITLRLRVRLSYRNVGSSPLILPLLKGLTAVIISPTLGDANQRRSQIVVPYFGRMTPEEISQEGNEPTLNHNFEIILPGGVFKRRFEREGDFDEYVILDIYNPAAKFQKVDLRGRKLFVQLELNHLRFPQSQADELTNRWQAYGYLWTGKVKSSPMEIDVPRSPKFADCSHEYKID
jgi:hypothetical protein